MEIKRETVTEPNGNDYIKVTVGDRSRLFDIGNENGIEAWLKSLQKKKPAKDIVFSLMASPEADVPDAVNKVPAEFVPMLADPEIITTPSEPKKAAKVWKKGKKGA